MEENNKERKNYYLGIDVGASKVRYGLFIKEGKCIGHIGQAISDQKKRGKGVLATLTSYERYKLYKFFTEERKGRRSCISVINIAKNQNLISMLSEIITSVVLSKLIYEGRIAAIGLGAPGPLDPLKGIIENPPNMPTVENLPIVEILEGKFKIPVFLLNDADAAVLGEAWQGAVKGLQNVVMLTLGTGVGSGVIVNGKLARGSGKGGEWGHTSIISQSLDRIHSFLPRMCSCGHCGCLEAYIGTKGLAQSYCEIFEKDKVDNQQKVAFWLSKGLKEGKDSRWKILLDVYASDLAEGIRNIICVHHPEVIILGGGISKLGQPLVDALKEKLLMFNDKVLSSLITGVQIKLAELEFAGVVGAAKHAMDEFELRKEDI